MLKFLKEVVFSFHPFRYKYLSNLKFRESLGYLSKVLFLAVIIASLISIPKIISLRADIVDELGKLSTFNVDGEVTTSAPIMIPQAKPGLIVDLSSPRNLSDESFLITKDNIQYRFFGKQTTSIDTILNVTENKQAAASFLTTAAMCAPRATPARPVAAYASWKKWMRAGI